MSENVRETLINRLENEREAVESACNVIDGVDVYEDLIKLFKSEQTDIAILSSIESAVSEKRDMWCEYLLRSEMNEDDGAEEELMRAENQKAQARILETYQSVWSSILEKKKATEKGID